MNFAGERAMQLEPGSIDAGYGLDFAPPRTDHRKPAAVEGAFFPWEA
jgi:hypothetical protein